MRSPFETNNATGTVDSVLGTAYDVVKKVADKLDLLQYISYYMEDITAVAASSVEHKKILTTFPAVSASKLVPLPTGVTTNNVMAIHVRCIKDGIYYFSENSPFILVSLTNAGISIGLTTGAPASLGSANITIALLLVG